MPIEIRMPALSPTMTEGNLTRWLKKEGDEVHSGDVIAEIETDKVLAVPAAAAPPARAPAVAPAATPAAAAAPGMPVFAKAQVLALAGNPPHTEKPHSAMRRVIARRLSESKQTVPHFYLSVDCTIDELLKIRKTLNDKAPKDEGGYRISVNDFVIRAAALALRQVPAANASWSDEAILLWDSVDIAVAVALDDGLITPIVKAADRKGLAAIANETKDLAARARAGKLKLEEFQGGTFSISNLGMFGVRDFAAVINPPHGGILAVGAGEKRPIVKNGALASATG